MIVTNIGYLKLEDVLKIEHFSIYNTHKKTQILVKDTSQNHVYLYQPLKDRLPWKVLEGKKICSGEKVFDSKLNSLDQLDTTKWNNGNQIMAYDQWNYSY